MPNGLKAVRDKQLLNELYEGIECKDAMLEEFRIIRHEYNNLIQNLVSYIEEENWSELKAYKSEVLRRTYLLNAMNLSRLTRIKSLKILTRIYKLLKRAEESGTTFKLKVYNDIKEINSNENGILKVMDDFIFNVFEWGYGSSEYIKLALSSNEEGYSIVFEVKPVVGKYEKFQKSFEMKIPSELRENIFVNFYLKGELFVQELLICL